MRRTITAVLLVVGLAAVVVSSSRSVAVYETAQNLGEQMARLKDLSWDDPATPIPHDAAVLTVNTTARRQELFGFGGAFTESASSVFSRMNAKQQEQLLHTYFDEDGVLGGYSLGRIPIGSCDFSLSTYSLDDITGDYSLEHFDWSLSRDQQTMIPLIKAALARAPQLSIYGSPWSPPVWLKVPHDGMGGIGMNGSAYPNGLLPDSRAQHTWAQYLSNWITAYERVLGHKLWGLTVQNEAQALQVFESCLYTRTFMRDFVKEHLGPTIRSQHPDIRIMFYDHNKFLHNTVDQYGPSDRILSEWVQTFLEDPVARDLVDGLAFHWYQFWDDVENKSFNFQALRDSQDVIAKYGNRHFMLATEACTCGMSKQDWLAAEEYGIDIAGDLANWAVGWVDWNLILDHKGGPSHIVGNSCDAPMRFTENNELLVLPKVYYMAHFSKFMRPGSVVVHSTSTDGEVDPRTKLSVVSAVTKQGQTVVVVVNPGSEIRSFALQDIETGRLLLTKIPEHSIQTYIY